MAHNLAHTVLRGDCFYYNRRVPRHVAEAFGRTAIRVQLGRDRETAEQLSRALTRKLEQLWSVSRVKPVCIDELVAGLRPQTLDLLSCSEQYLADREIDERPVKLAVAELIKVAGNKDVRSYTRAESRQLVESFLQKGNKTATVRRRVQSIHAVFEYGFHELDDSKRNPFARLTIPQEGRDVTRRNAFSEEQLACLYRDALMSYRDTRLILPILGETGARLAEIVGLRWEDVCPAFVERILDREQGPEVTLGRVLEPFPVEWRPWFRTDTSCPVPDDHIDSRRSALLMARSILREVCDGGREC